MDKVIDTGAGQFELTEDQRAIQEMAGAFALDRVAPDALEWDRTKHFPADVIRETGPLGFGGIYIGEDVGGSGLGRLDAVLIFEALSRACPAFASFISIHNMSAWMIDTFAAGTPSRLETIWLNVVSWPCPWLCVPVNTVTLPVGCTRTWPDS